MLKRVARVAAQSQRTAFFKRAPIASPDAHRQLYGPTSIQKIEADSYEAGLDIFQQFDHGVVISIRGEGTRDNPYIVPSRNENRVILVDDSGEAPGVAGLGHWFSTFIIWESGDGESGPGVTRCPHTGDYYKLVKWEFPEMEVADHHSNH